MCPLLTVTLSVPHFCLPFLLNFLKVLPRLGPTFSPSLTDPSIEVWLCLHHTTKMAALETRSPTISLIKSKDLLNSLPHLIAWLHQIMLFAASWSKHPFPLVSLIPYSWFSGFLSEDLLPVAFLGSCSSVSYTLVFLRDPTLPWSNCLLTPWALSLGNSTHAHLWFNEHLWAGESQI